MQLVQSPVEARETEFQSWLLASKPESFNIMLLRETSLGLAVGAVLVPALPRCPCVTSGKSAFSPLTIGLGLWILRPLPTNAHLVLQPGLHHASSVTTSLQTWTTCPAVSDFSLLSKVG